VDWSGALKDEEGHSTMKKFWELTDGDIEKIMGEVEWNRANYEYFRGGGYSSRFYTNAEMPMTMVRINLVQGIGPTLQIAEGYSCNLDQDVSDVLDERTDKTWPTTWF